jgi:molybdate transport system substrate-binding protein
MGGTTLPDLKIMSAGAVKPMVAAIGAEYERANGIKIDFNFGTAGSLRERVEKGEAADLVVLSQSAIATLGRLDLVDPKSAKDLGRTVTGVVVREGSALPDISTPEAFKQALLAARSVAYTDPKAGGSGGIMFAAMLDKLGIADAVNKKAVLGKGGVDVTISIVEGRADIGTTFISEVLPIKGAQVVGPLPGDWYNANTYSAAVHVKSTQGAAARAFLAALSDPATRARWTAAGLEPAF